jgi:hypothetical protein
MSKTRTKTDSLQTTKGSRLRMFDWNRDYAAHLYRSLYPHCQFPATISRLLGEATRHEFHIFAEKRLWIQQQVPLAATL